MEIPGYICDTLRTDSLSLWGGDLRVQNFELRSDELAKARWRVGPGFQWEISGVWWFNNG